MSVLCLSVSLLLCVYCNCLLYFLFAFLLPSSPLLCLFFAFLVSFLFYDLLLIETHWTFCACPKREPKRLLERWRASLLAHKVNIISIFVKCCKYIILVYSIYVCTVVSVVCLYLFIISLSYFILHISQLKVVIWAWLESNWIYLKPSVETIQLCSKELDRLQINKARTETNYYVEHLIIISIKLNLSLHKVYALTHESAC